MPLIDPNLVPEDVVSPAGVESVNTLIDALRTRQVLIINMQEPPKGFRVSNMVRAYCQSQLWRCLDLVDSAEALRLSENGLGAMIMVRAVYETVAAFLHFEGQLSKVMMPLESQDDLKRIDDFVRGKAFTTRRENLKKIEGGEAAIATSVVTQINKMKNVYPDVRDDYDYLCEFAHPNGFGGFLWYGKLDQNSDSVSFSRAGPDPKETLFWVLEGAHLLDYFVKALDRIDSEMPNLSAFGARLDT